jgi:hypothetical protein
MTAMNAARSTGATIDAADCKTTTVTAMAAATITDRAMGENPLRRCIVSSLEVCQP